MPSLNLTKPASLKSIEEGREELDLPFSKCNMKVYMPEQYFIYAQFDIVDNIISIVSKKEKMKTYPLS